MPLLPVRGRRILVRKPHCHPMLDLASRDNTDRKVGALAIEQRSMKRAVEDMKVLQGHDQPDAWAVSRNVCECRMLLVDQPVGSLQLLDALVEHPLQLG